jgi:peptidylprolyl isomerase
MLKIPGGKAPRTVRRAAGLVLIPLLAASAIAGCGSSSSNSAGSSSSAAKANTSVMASGTFGASPHVTVPKEKAGSNLYTKTLINGSGQTLTTGDSLVGNFVLYDWSGTTAKLVTSTFKAGQGPVLFSGQMLPGLNAALVGQKTGSRVLAVLPPKDGFGSAGNSQIGVKGTDTLVFVIDMISTVPDNASAAGTSVTNGGGSLPTVTQTAGKPATIKMPSSNPPANLSVTTLVQGSGPKVAKGDYVVVQYTGAIWKGGKVFDSSWSRSSPFAFSLGAGQVVKGWDDGLVGQSVGSRVMLVIPPADGYGSSGAPQVGIQGTDTLVFVVDIVGSFAPSK